MQQRFNKPAPMKNLAKLVVVLAFGFLSAAVVLSSVNPATSLAQVTAQPTPPANTGANTAAANIKPPANTQVASSPSGSKTITKSFILGKDSQTEDGEVPFDHETHATKMYSPDGKSTIACIECHHTDQPKSALKPPLSTSERDVTLTLASWQASSQKVNECRSCHFQSGSIPEGKSLPTATYSERGKEVTKDLNNELAYHINCNTCHDAAAKLRPELKSKAGFATGVDCKTCHRPN
jgi:Zn ribbon nucleic-acid-binding protein